MLVLHCQDTHSEPARQMTRTMNRKQAYKLGVESGFDSGMNGEFTQDHLLDWHTFMGECSEICSNKRQYADDPSYDIARQSNSESLFDAYEEGESAGMRKAWRKLLPKRRKAEAQRELSDAIDQHERREYDEYFICVSDTSEIPDSFRGSVLYINERGNCAIYVKTARKLREVAACV